jgi:hypothetical protein
MQDWLRMIEEGLVDCLVPELDHIYITNSYTGASATRGSNLKVTCDMLREE